MVPIFQFNNTDSSPSPELLDFARSLARQRQAFEGRQVRRSPREPFVVSVLTQPLCDDLRAEGDPFWAVAMDVSAGGLCLISPTRFRAAHVQLRIRLPAGGEMNPCLKITRCRPIGPYFEIAGRFQTLIDTRG